MSPPTASGTASAHRNTRSGKAAFGSAFMLLQMFLKTGVPLVVSPLLVRVEGQEALGAYAVMMEAMIYLFMLDIGMNQAITREIALRSGDGDGRSVGEILSTSAFFLLGVGAVIGALAMSLAASLPLWLRAGAEVTDAAVQGMLILAVWIPLRFPVTLLHIWLFARQEIALYAGIDILGGMVRLSCSLGFVLIGWSIPGLVVAGIIAQLSVAAICFVRFRSLIRTVPWRARPSVPIMRRLMAVGFPLAMVGLGERLTYFSQNIIVGSTFDARTAAAFYATRAPGFFLYTVIWKATDSAIPGLSDLYGRGLKAALGWAYLRLAGYVVGTGLWAAAGIVAFNRGIVGSWLGEDLYIGASLTAGMALLAPLIAFKYLTAKLVVIDGKVTTYMWVTLAEGITSIALSVIFALAAGPGAVIWGTVATQPITIGYVLIRAARIVQVRPSVILTRSVVRGAACAATGIVLCGAYWLAQAIPTLPQLHWIVAAGAAGAGGFIGFSLLGLESRDRSTLIAVARRPLGL